MWVAIFSEVLPLFRSFVIWFKTAISNDIFSRHPFTWCATPFVKAPRIDPTETVDFNLLFKRQHVACFKMESPIMRLLF